MLFPLVRGVPVPVQSRLWSLSRSAYFVDAYAVTLPSAPRTNYTAEALARIAFGQPPAWFNLLMFIRDAAMSVFGVKPSAQIQGAAHKKGIETISIFPVLSRTEDEIIMGETDKHLDFQLSILVQDQQPSLAPEPTKGSSAPGREVVATTIVHSHGFLGKAYLTIIKPFHSLIVRYNMNKLSNELKKAEK